MVKLRNFLRFAAPVESGLYRSAKKNPSSPDSPDPYSIQWDLETGMPIGLHNRPTNAMAEQYQWKAKEVTAQRNAALKRQAMTYLRQGARSSESFRPGGYAGTAGSGYAQAQAQLSMDSQINEPDMLGDWRKEQDRLAQQQAKKAQTTQLAITAAAAIASAVTLGTAAPVAAAAINAGSQLARRESQGRNTGNVDPAQYGQTPGQTGNGGGAEFPGQSMGSTLGGGGPGASGSPGGQEGAGGGQQMPSGESSSFSGFNPQESYGYELSAKLTQGSQEQYGRYLEGYDMALDGMLAEYMPTGFQ